MRILGGFVWAVLLIMAGDRVISATEPRAAQVTAAQMEQTLRDASGHSDADLAQQISTMELTERVGVVQLTKLLALAPGEKSRMALILVADKAMFEDAPASAAVAVPAPDPAATRAMLVKVVNYVNTTNRQLPNLMAERTTTGFEDRPKQDALEATGIVSYSYQPLHWVGRSTITVTYRDRKEVVDERIKEKKEGAGIGGLSTTGEFGPILSTVVSDALKGKITWARWERENGAATGVFHYEVPEDKSNYRVQFCCVVGGYGADGTADLEKFDERAGYQGEIAFNPQDGAVLRLTARAQMPSGGLVAHAGFAIEYGPEEIGGRTYICPVHGVARLEAHTTRQAAAFSKSAYRGDPKTFLNDIAFSNYRRFGSEMRMVPAAVQ